MAQTLRFIVVREGAVDTLDEAPTLSSPQGNYGVELVSDKSVVVAADTPMEADGLGWVYEVGDTYADDDAVLRYYVHTGDYYVGRTTNFVRSACLVIGRYTDSTQIEKWYGTEEIAKWLPCGDHEEPVEYALRMSLFIEQAEACIDDVLRGAVEIGDTVPTRIRDLATMKAGVLMYESKGIIDVDQVTGYRMHRLAYVCKDIEAQLEAIKSGKVRLAIDSRKAYLEAHVEDE